MAGASAFVHGLRKGFNLNEKKEYVEFLCLLAEKVQEKYDGTVTAEVMESKKNNGVSVTGLMLKKEGNQVAPNFFLEKQFSEWECGVHSLEEIAGRLCATFEEEIEKNSHLVSAIVFQWEEFRHNVFMRLVNREKNTELLKNIPYREFMDLAIVYFYAVKISEESQGTMVITEEHLSMLGIEQEELHRAAEENVRKLRPTRLCRMEELVVRLSDRLGIPVPVLREEQRFMYVLSNEPGMFGAVNVTLTEELERFSACVSPNFYVLPSSVHEVILVPDDAEFHPEKFADIVRDINATQVLETEVLSDSVYYFDGTLKRLRRVG